MINKTARHGWQYLFRLWGVRHLWKYHQESARVCLIPEYSFATQLRIFQSQALHVWDIYAAPLNRQTTLIALWRSVWEWSILDEFRQTCCSRYGLIEVWSSKGIPCVVSRESHHNDESFGGLSRLVASHDSSRRWQRPRGRPLAVRRCGCPACPSRRGCPPERVWDDRQNEASSTRMRHRGDDAS